MASLAKIFGGVLLLVSGITIIYESSLRHLVEIVTILGFILVIIGFYLLILSFFERNKSPKLQDFKKNSDNNSKMKKLDNNLESKNNRLNKDNGGRNTNSNKNNMAANLGKNLNNSKLGSLDTKKISDKVRDVSKNKDPKSVLKPILPKSNEDVKMFRFTPNYEKPMKVNRRPQKRNKSSLNGIDNINNKNNEINAKLNKNLNNKNNNLGSNNNSNNNIPNLNDLPGEKSEIIVRALASDDFIKPIHTESKSILEPNVSDSNELDLNNSNNIYNSNNSNNLNKNNQDNNYNSFLDNDSEEITIDDLENDFVNINNNTSPQRLDSLDNKELSKFLSSYVVCSKGKMTSKEAFDELAKSAKSEIYLEMPSIKEMTNDFLSKISSLDVKIIIQEFNIKDMSYVLLITSLLEQGVKIRTLPLINTINLIADDSHALIISENDSLNDLDIGAVYNDSKSISNVKSMFKMSWDLANDLDINNITKEFS
ncbi:hypothetical protein KQY27_08710 [Methanobrevibacter sp. TMH8]|uniref:hypothetical protein n=1 Tax=Methanobrevibacter sp. TMH8 TaxID=2848611 RepID=UPI001CCB14BF|nr:hypothetical protein [Methanobrevibacter sp. TMH8]MBZ9571626.1 hypothetical protein [Methanobrevibacter sp. TMH8]